MAATEHAVIASGGVVVNMIMIDTTTDDGAAYLQALVATGDTVVDVSALDPQPGIDWTTADGGQTFTAPAVTPDPPPPPPPVTPDQMAAAVTNVQQLADSLPAQITQAQADATTLSTLTAGQSLTADQVAALQRAQQGWCQLLPALQSLVTAAGLAPPPA